MPHIYQPHFFDGLRMVGAGIAFDESNVGPEEAHYRTCADETVPCQAVAPREFVKTFVPEDVSLELDLFVDPTIPAEFGDDPHTLSELGDYVDYVWIQYGFTFSPGVGCDKCVTNVHGLDVCEKPYFWAVLGDRPFKPGFYVVGTLPLVGDAVTDGPVVIDPDPHYANGEEDSTQMSGSMALDTPVFDSPDPDARFLIPYADAVDQSLGEHLGLKSWTVHVNYSIVITLYQIHPTTPGQIATGPARRGIYFGSPHA